MKQKVRVTKEIDFKYCILDVAVRYDEEDIPNDFPFRVGDVWNPKIDIDNATIVDWPIGDEFKLHMKVCDQGTYTLLDSDENEVVQIDGYVPHGLIPGSYGDYIEMDIDGYGKILNFPSSPNVDDFYEDDD